MSDMNEVFPSSFELWEFVSSFEDGSLPASTWNDRTLAVVAIWYLFLLPPGEAIRRLEAGIRRNHPIFSQRSSTPGDGIDAGGEIWPAVMRHVLTAFGEGDPVTIANRLMPPVVAREARARAA